jgi:hypothetical protein
LVAALKALQHAIDSLTRQVTQCAKAPRVAALKEQLPSVGAQTVLTLDAELGIIGHGVPCPDNFDVLREVNYFELDPIRVAKEYGVVPGSVVVLFRGIKNFPTLCFDVFR